MGEVQYMKQILGYSIFLTQKQKREYLMEKSFSFFTRLKNNITIDNIREKTNIAANGNSTYEDIIILTAIAVSNYVTLTNVSDYILYQTVQKHIHTGIDWEYEYNTYYNKDKLISIEFIFKKVLFMEECRKCLRMTYHQLCSRCEYIIRSII